MFYKVIGLRGQHPYLDHGQSGFCTYDGTVTEARPAMQWAVGKDIRKIMAWCWVNHIEVKVRQSSNVVWRRISL